MNNQRHELSRLDRIFIKLAQAHMPDLLKDYWADRDESSRIRKHARQFASAGVVIVAGNLPEECLSNPKLKERVVGLWIRPYRKLYQLLTQGLFPNVPALHVFKSQYADLLDPPIVILQGEATMVWHRVAGCINPYVDNRQRYHNATRAEFYSIMSLILDSLEAGSGLLRSKLIQDGIPYLEEMVNSPVNHISLTNFDLDVVELFELKKGSTQPLHPPPSVLPERTSSVAPSPAPPSPVAPDKHIPFDLDYVEDEEPPPSGEMLRYNVNTDTKKLSFGPPIPRIPRNPNDDDKNNGRR